MRRILGTLTRRRLLIAVAGGVALVLLASPTALGDAISNVAPASQVSGLSTEFPLGNYALDSHFSAISVGLFSGVNVSGVPPMIAYFLANTLWQLTAFLANALVTLFTFAFSLDLVNGSQATGGAGALAPVSSAVHTIYSTVFGAPWLTVAVVLAGMWAMWKALVQRRYVETAGALALSLIYVVIALAFVTEPQATIGSASRWTNEMSAAFLSLTSQGNLSNQQQAKQADADQLFDVLVYQPWVVLQFGGVEHCVITGTSNSASVQPLTAQESQALANGTQIQVGDRTCINNANKYASHFLRYSPDASDRTDEYTALEKGDSGDLPSSDPSKANGSYKLGPADEPAAAAMGQGGQYQRLLLAIVIFAGECGAFLLLGVLSVAVILAQVIVLLLLAFAPVALVLAVFPGRGHEFFLSWLTRLATFLLRKAIYSLILAVLLAVAAALDSASADLGWLMSFGLEATFFWAVFLYRNQLTSRLSLATTGHSGNEGSNALKLAYLYTAARAFRIYGGHGNRGGQGGGSRSGDNRGGSTPPPSDPPSPPSDTPPPPDSPQTPPTPTVETASPASTPENPATVSAVSTTHGDTPVSYTPAGEVVSDQSVTRGTTTGVEPATEPTGASPRRPVESEPVAQHERPETRASTNATQSHPPTPSARARPSDKSTSTTATAARPPAPPAADPEAQAAHISSAKPEAARRAIDSGHAADSPANAAAAVPGGEPQAPAASPLAESVRHDLHRVASIGNLAPDRTQAPSGAQIPPASRAPAAPSTPRRPDAQAVPATEPPASQRRDERRHRSDEREGR